MNSSSVKKVFSDFDGTLTETDGSLSQNFITVLDYLQKKKIPLTIVTGRSLSWGHFFITHFPQVDSVICEGGGVIVYRAGNGLMMEENLVSEDDYLFLEKVAFDLTDSFDCSLSLDSFGRRTDRAIDLYKFKDNQGLKKQIETFLREKGLSFSSSNVHLNFWKGEVSKSTQITRLRIVFFLEMLLMMKVLLSLFLTVLA